MSEYQDTPNPSARHRLLAIALRCQLKEPGDLLDDAIFIEVGCMVGDCLAYTTSLDAAKLLVPSSCAWELRVDITFRASATVYGHDIHADCDANTPALALCAAALRARAQGAT